MSIYTDIQQNQRGGLLSSSFLLSIFLMGNGINALFNAFQGSHHIAVSRSFLKQYLYSIFIGLFISFLLIFSVVLYVFFELTILDNLSAEGIIDNGSSWPMIAEYVLLLLLTIVIPAVLFYFGTPGGRNEKLFSPAVYITSAMFVISTLLFGVYVSTFSSYNELYGSIGALLVLMLYIWINSVILLLGFELRSILNGLKKE
jgi:membrane protein